MTQPISPSEAKARLHAGAEIAFLDVREAGQFGEDHPLFAIPCPYSRLEARALELVPNRAVPVLLIDSGDGVAERAAGHLAALGYSDVSVVEGGVPGWQGAGLTLFKGVNVPSKTLGELAEHEWHPKTVDAKTLREWQAQGDVSLFDGRPPSEYGKMHVPGAVCMPNGELPHRLGALAGRTKSRIVVGCAGRTRGIVGALGLKLMGYEGDIYALENGTQGWVLSGFELERGVKADEFPELDEAARDETRRRARDFARTWDIPTAGAQDVAAMLDDGSRTSFVFDVRSEAEAARDPVACARHALSGQLVQASDQFIGVRHARVVLCDDLGARAGLTAFWLRQLGFEPYVALLDDAMRALPARRREDPRRVDLASVEPGAALEELRRGTACLLDLRPSTLYRQAHLDGAVWATRPRLGSLLPDSPRVLLIGDDEALRGAALDLAALDVRDVATVRGGHEALVAAGAGVVATPGRPDEDEAIDFLRFVHDRHDGNLEASRRYLEWEMGLIGQLDAQERAEFRLATRPSRG